MIASGTCSGYSWVENIPSMHEMVTAIVWVQYNQENVKIVCIAKMFALLFHRLVNSRSHKETASCS